MVTPQRKFSVIIIDDNHIAIVNLKGFLKRRHPDFEVVGEGDFEKGFKLIEQGGIDVAFIDITDERPPNPNNSAGVDLAYRINQFKNKPLIVFYTAYPDEYLKEIKESRLSISFGAIHKPIVNADADVVIDRIRREFTSIVMTPDKLLEKIKNEPLSLVEKDWRFLFGTAIINGLDFKLSQKLLSLNGKESTFLMVWMFSTLANEDMLSTKEVAKRLKIESNTSRGGEEERRHINSKIFTDEQKILEKQKKMRDEIMKALKNIND